MLEQRPFSTGTGVNSDHLELTVWRRADSVLRKLGVLLGANGQLQVRLWMDGADERYAAGKGTWRRTRRGYAVDLSLERAVFQELEPLIAVRLGVEVSDADARGRQETLMGNRGSLRFWSEYPPTLDEYWLRQRASSVWQ